jgi:Protein of unknown function (DUF3467)
MPRAGKTRAVTKRAKSEPLTVKISIDASPDAGIHYVNLAEVGHSRHDFFVLLARTPIKPSQTELVHIRETGEVHVEALVQLVMPPTFVPGLINALQTRLSAYEMEFGPIGAANERGTKAKNGS